MSNNITIMNRPIEFVTKVQLLDINNSTECIIMSTSG